MISSAIGRKEGSPCLYIETVAVHEKLKGQTVWQGEVHVFDLDRPPEERCYVWVDSDDNRPVTVLNRPPVESPETAVRAYIVSRGKR
jgi:hypothetical protein